VKNGTLIPNIFEGALYRFDSPAEHESIVDATLTMQTAMRIKDQST